jgi:hypothetical protein
MNGDSLKIKVRELYMWICMDSTGSVYDSIKAFNTGSWTFAFFIRH